MEALAPLIARSASPCWCVRAKPDLDAAASENAGFVSSQPSGGAGAMPARNVARRMASISLPVSIQSR
jgi:hypothetical protein